ncbi:MAG: ABC transporter ATP-binding protein [Actinomycetes bacterium]
MNTQLPVADRSTLRAYAGRLLRRHPRALLGALALHTVAAVAGLAGPWLLGDLVQAVQDGTTTAHANTVALALGGFIVAQSLLTRAARLASFVLGERVLAELREDFLAAVVRLPLGTVEKAGTGDLLTRSTSDIDTLARTVRFAVPEVLVALVTSVLTLAAAFLAAPLLAAVCLVSAPFIWIPTLWYLRRAPEGYLRERASYSTLASGVAETVDGGRTVDALRLGRRRLRQTDDDIAGSYAAERYTLGLRTVWFPFLDWGFVLPVAATLLAGGLLHAEGLVTIGQVTTVCLYAVALADPVDRLLMWLDEVQVGASVLARLVGVGQVPPDRMAGAARPRDEHIVVSGLRFAYLPGRDVLHGVDLDLRPGERLAVVGLSGAGKSTLGRLLAGIHGPREGSVTVGGVPLVELPLEELRGHVALVTQEHHVFVGTLAENLRLALPDATEDDLWRAMDAVDALGWLAGLPDGLGTQVGADGLALTPAQAQQVALARLVLADPHTLVLDEATSLLDPRAARHLERSLSAVLHGRTVVAIAHRLHTAHDADRVAVVDDGRILELGSHDELMAADGAYADLWRSWTRDARDERDDVPGSVPVGTTGRDSVAR